MATPQLTLVFIGVLAAGLGYLGLFKQFGDRWTPVLLTFASATTWGVFGISSLSVITSESGCCPRIEALMPLVMLGLGFAFITALFGFAELLGALQGQAEESDIDLAG